METPEKKLSAEFDSVETPLAYRLAHLGISPSAVYPKLTIQQIADRLGIDSNLVRRQLIKYGVESESLFHSHQQSYHDHYPYYAFEFIREERAWWEWYLTLPERLNAHQVAEAVGRSYGWTVKTLRIYYPDAQLSRSYPRTSAKKLREITFATPPDENWPTLPRLVEFTGRDREWVLNRLDKTTIRPEIRMQSITGREFPHYPPDTFEALQEAMEQRAEPAGDWLTTYAISKVLGKSGRWVKKRIEESYSSTGVPKLDDMGVERIHYPPSTLQSLFDELSELEKLKPAGDWATISTLEKQIGIHAVTLTKIIQQIQVDSEMRLDRKGRPKLHYSPTTQRLLASKAMELYGYPEANGWFTYTIAQKIIGRSARWIHQQLHYRQAVSEIRLDTSGRPAQHYDPAIIYSIKDYGDTLEAGTMVSVKDIMERTQKSRVWVIARLDALNAIPEKRNCKNGNLINHYPENIIHEILSLK